MKPIDRIELCWTALREQRLRTLLSLTGIAIAVASVLLLVSVGEGARLYVLGAFSQFGTNLLQVTPGKTETFGIPGAMGGTTHALTLGDAQALERLPLVQVVVPTVIGEARVEGNGRGRRVSLIGTTAAAREVWKVRVARGSFLPAGEAQRGTNAAVLGAKLARELYGDETPLGSWVRIGGWRLRVVGVMESRGELLGFDMDDLAYVSVGTALSMFDLEGLSEIDVTFAHESATETVAQQITALLRARHDERDDVTIVTQTAALGVLDRVLRGVTLAVAAIAAVSLVVGAIGILTTMWIAVSQRTHEIGLLRALGATLRQVQALFLLEAVLLSLSGGAAGLALAAILILGLTWFVPGLPVETPLPAVLLALMVSAATGLFSGVARLGSIRSRPCARNEPALAE
ncbi:MAG: ABC transporter permease, partial [Planctomycetes bacterium]|nr:ABC transporter permease [Planctomycetota bacterium]